MSNKVTTLEQLSSERQQFEYLRRTIFIIAGSLGVVIIALATLEMIFIDEPSAFFALFLVNNVLFGVFVATVVVLSASQRMPQEQIEQLTLGVFAVESLLFNGIIAGLTVPTLARLYTETVGDDIWFLLIICIFILHLFPLQRAFLLVTGMYSASLLILGWRIWLGLETGDFGLVTEIVRIYTFGAILVIVLYLLVRYRENVHELRTQHRTLQEIAFVDPLTQLFNRRYLSQILDEQIQIWHNQRLPCCVLIADIDHFKQINDRFGHAVGDAVLVQVGQLLCDTVRSTDVVGRWGGEEFLIIMRLTECDAALLIAERLCERVAHAECGVHERVTLSIGVAAYIAGDSSDALLQRADLALYAAKAAGRNQVQVARAPLPAAILTMERV